MVTIHCDVVGRVNLSNNKIQIIINYNSNFITDLSVMNDRKQGIERKSWSILKSKLIKYDGLDTGGVSSKHFFRA